MNLKPLIDSVLQLGAADLASEEKAIAALLQLRWPNGVGCPRCDCCCRQDGVRFQCERRGCGHRFTILIGTALGSLRRPRIRAILLALRAMAVSKRGVSALELARETGVPHTTLWRHMHRLRAMLPSALPTAPVTVQRPAIVHVCGRRVDLDEWEHHFCWPGIWPAWIGIRRVGEVATVCTMPPPGPGARADRIIGETVRTWLNGTFHGVRSRYLWYYAQEVTARFAYDARQIIRSALRTLFKLDG